MASLATETSAPGPRIEEAWIDLFFQAADALDIEAVLAWFADDVELRFGNMPATIGKPAAQEALSAFWSSIAGMRHARQEVIQNGELAVQVAEVTYVRLDGDEVSVPVASHLRRTTSGRIDRLWVFVDLSPLFSPLH